MYKVEPLFIIGYPRSGTTYLLHLLLSSGHYPVYNFSETHFYSYFYRRYGSLKKDENFDRLCRDIIVSPWFKNSKLTEDEFLNNIESREYRAVLSSFMNTISKKQNKKRWVEKTPWHLKFVNEILSDFPDAKFILIVRDPRDVVLSISKYGWNSGILNGFTRKAVAWRWHMEYVFKAYDIYKEKFLCIKYEDLVLDLNNTIEQINRFLNINIDAELLRESSFGVLGKPNSSFKNYKNKSSNRAVSRWRNYLNDREIFLIEYSVGNQLQKWGYDKSKVNKNIIFKLYVILLKQSYYLLKELRLLLFPLVRR